MRKILDQNQIVLGTKRIRKEFLLLPKTIKNEWRWLEKAEWEEEYISKVRWRSIYVCGGGCYYYDNEWEPVCWIN